MIYRIDFQNFLVHAIDYLTLSDITNLQYLIISAKVNCNGRCLNVNKYNLLYPTSETVIEYASTGDKDMLERSYRSMIKDRDKDPDNEFSPLERCIYKAFINPLLMHVDVFIVCDRTENDYIDVLCKILKEDYAIDVIDLNMLFTKGHVGPIYIDRDEIRDIAVDVRRDCSRQEVKDLASTPEGKMKLIGLMTKKEKIKKLKEEYGIRVTKDDFKDLDAILFDAWESEDES